MRKSKAGADFIFFSAFLIRGSLLKLEAGSCLWDDEQCLWVFSILFLYRYSQYFFGCFGLCFRKQVDLLALWFAQALTCMNFNKSNLVHLHQLLGLPCEGCDTFSPALGTDGGHHSRLLSLCPLGTNTSNVSCFQHPLGYIAGYYRRELKPLT